MNRIPKKPQFAEIKNIYGDLLSEGVYKKNNRYCFLAYALFIYR